VGFVGNPAINGFSRSSRIPSRSAPSAKILSVPRSIFMIEAPRQNGGPCALYPAPAGDPGSARKRRMPDAPLPRTPWRLRRPASTPPPAGVSPAVFLDRDGVLNEVLGDGAR